MQAATQIEAATRTWQRAGPGVLVVAIDGPGGSGKTTIATELARMIDAAVVHLDDFFRAQAVEASTSAPDSGAYMESSRADARSALSEARSAHSEPADRDPLARYYDRGALRDDALVPLRAGRAASYDRRHWDDPGRTGPRVTVHPSPVVVLEGVSASAPTLADLVDRTVLVTTPASIRLGRLRQRIPEAIWDEEWLAAEARFFAARAPAAFDLVVPGWREEDREDAEDPEDPEDAEDAEDPG